MTRWQDLSIAQQLHRHQFQEYVNSGAPAVMSFAEWQEKMGRMQGEHKSEEAIAHTAKRSGTSAIAPHRFNPE